MAEHHDVAGHGSADQEYVTTPAGAGHEHTDASVRIIVKFGVWLAVAAIVIHIGIGFLFGLFSAQREEPVARFPLATGQAPRLPSQPRLQRFPENDLYRFRLQEEEALRGYGWIDREAGTVRIPIREAMRLTVERGLPARATVPEPARGAAAGPPPGDSSAGRTMERSR